jgi:hypothetical protein
VAKNSLLSAKEQKMTKTEMQPFEAYEKFMKVLAEPGTFWGGIDNEG